MSEHKITRREVLGIAGAGALIGGGRLLWAPTTGSASEKRTRERMDGGAPPADELVNTMAFEREAELALPEALFREIAGGDRESFDRLTLRPRMNVPTLDLDLGVRLFGEDHFSPIVVGPIANQARYHPQGELATVRGAGDAHAGMVVNLPASVPIEEVASEARSPLWGAVYATDPEAPRRVSAAVDAGIGAVFSTVGASPPSGSGAPEPVTTAIDWQAIERIRAAAGDVPVVLKGIMDPADAEEAVARGAEGLVVSNHGTPGPTGRTPMEVLPSIAEVVAGRVPIFIDGSFRRGTDALKALILGADAVMIGRPTMWGLAAYGSEGVSLVVQLVQHELARCFAMLGVERPGELTLDRIRTHGRVTR